jgi:hypothetical protein
VAALMFERIIGNWRRVVAAEMRVAAVGLRHVGRAATLGPSCAALFVFVKDPGQRSLPVPDRRRSLTLVLTFHLAPRLIAARRSVRTRDRGAKIIQGDRDQEDYDPFWPLLAQVLR